MLHVGITGGIGAGKSVVCTVFSKLGIPVYNADAAAKSLMHNDPLVKQKLTTTFGESVFANGHLNTEWLRMNVFKNTVLINQLNSIVHPAVAVDFQRWAAAQHNVPYTLREAAILYESGTNVGLDFVILVDAPAPLRTKRIEMRDHRTAEEIENIMTNQWSSEKKRNLADFVIENDDQHLLLPQILMIHQKIVTACE